MVHGLIRQFLTDVAWGELDYLVIDMPPGTGDAALTLTQMAPLSGAVIVTTANELSLIDARKGAPDVREGERARARHRREHVVLHAARSARPQVLPVRPGRRRAASPAELGVDFLGEVPIDPRVVEGGDKGRPIVLDAPDSPAALAFRELAGAVARKLAVLAERDAADRGREHHLGVVRPRERRAASAGS